MDPTMHCCIQPQSGTWVQSHNVAWKKYLLSVCESTGEWLHSNVPPSVTRLPYRCHGDPGSASWRVCHCNSTSAIPLQQLSNRHTSAPARKILLTFAFVSIFRQIFNFQTTRASVCTLTFTKSSISGSLSWPALVDMTPGSRLLRLFLIGFLNYGPFLILGGLHPPEKGWEGKKTIQMIFSEFILCPVSRSPPPFWSLFSSPLCPCPLW